LSPSGVQTNRTRIWLCWNCCLLRVPQINNQDPNSSFVHIVSNLVHHRPTTILALFCCLSEVPADQTLKLWLCSGCCLKWGAPPEQLGPNSALFPNCCIPSDFSSGRLLFPETVVGRVHHGT
jgi:hypothetical protein